MQDCSILVGGDICPRGRDLPAFEKGDVSTLFGFLLPTMANADFVVANLETPLTARRTPIAKTGPNFGASERCASTVRQAGVDAVTLANNHIMDQGAGGLLDTVAACEDAGLKTFGAGSDLDVACEPLELDVNGVLIALLGVADREFSIAGRGRAGACPLDIMSFVRFMRERGSDYHHVIVLLHGGAEHYPLPSPELQRVCRFLAEEGASAVICQHSHHMGAIEVVNCAPIVYGQGNFIFENRRAGGQWHKGFLVQLRLSSDRADTEFELIPFQHRADAAGLTALTREEEDALHADMAEWSAVLGDASELQRRWHDFCEGQRRTYFSLLRGQNRYVRFVDRYLGFAERLLSKRAIVMLLALFRCEVHREAVVTLLEARYERYLNGRM